MHLLVASKAQQASVGKLCRCFAAQAQRTPKVEIDAKRILCVASCKGGVGKSSVALNLACALALQGKRVGLLDMDIYGPSLPSLLPMLRAERITGTPDGHVNPLQWGDHVLPKALQVMSYGFLKPNEYLAVRGPILSGISTALLTTINWKDLDTLVLDMPPGTGDVHLTVAQQVAVDASIMVTTPEMLALVDVDKGVRMFDNVAIPTIAVVENMSYLDCGNCSTRHSIFGEGGGQRLAEQFGIESFHQLPLDPSFNSSSAHASEGPILANKEEANKPIVQAMRDLAAKVDADLDAVVATRADRPTLVAADRGASLILSEGGMEPVTIPARTLRLACKCARCVDEWTNKPILDPKKVPLDVEAMKVVSAGRYAVNIQWTDFHTSIYPFKQIRALC